MKRCAKCLCGCLRSSFGGFLYAAVYMFATMFTCPVDHHCDIYQKKKVPCLTLAFTFKDDMCGFLLKCHFLNFVGSLQKLHGILFHYTIERKRLVFAVLWSELAGCSMFTYKKIISNYILVGFSKP